MAASRERDPNWIEGCGLFGLLDVERDTLQPHQPRFRHTTTPQFR